jgi:hypothetical protein
MNLHSGRDARPFGKPAVFQLEVAIGGGYWPREVARQLIILLAASTWPPHDLTFSRACEQPPTLDVVFNCLCAPP